tara:strand:- start:74 stop:283 length:210 start_codon:yes stop_codon:yes gene_type:complete
MSNPNNNKNFNDEALRINRTLKKENDALSELVDEFENHLLNYNVTSSADDREIGRLQDMILKVRSRDGT